MLQLTIKGSAKNVPKFNKFWIDFSNRIKRYTRSGHKVYLCHCSDTSLFGLIIKINQNYDDSIYKLGYEEILKELFEEYTIIEIYIK
jgi:pyruvate formate-lyase activating enzyme-like uncharacterized protein